MLLPLHLFLLLSSFALSVASSKDDEVMTKKCSNGDSADSESCADPTTISSRRVPDGCGLVLAPVSDNDWRVYSLMDRKRGQPIVPYGDVVQQLADMEIEATFLYPKVWNGQETGGQCEGYDRVDSLVPGIAMLARSDTEKYPNLLPFVPRVDEAGLTRQKSPGAGAITHYHNYTLFYTKDVRAGDELIMSRKTRGERSLAKEGLEEENPSLFDLLQTGYCLDNIKPKKSRIKDAGRGAFATRNLKKGNIIAPVPVLPISRAHLETDASDGSPTYQLLLNYCFSHEDLSTVFYPFGPWVNLINHYPETNVKLQLKDQAPPPASKDASYMTMMMELVATKSIQAGEELYIDYGRSWEKAWHEHLQRWKPFTNRYSPGFVVDDSIRLLRTEAEQKDHPYPDNVDTSCFYRYSDRTEEEKAQGKKASKAKDSKVMTFQWKVTKGLYDPKHLRPCKVLQRKETAAGRSGYAVRMFNRPGLDEGERIPKGEMHIVTHIPRNAIRITDKPGSTDQHLPGAFRAAINLPDDVLSAEFMEQFQ